jgi:hypothetical protein
MAAGRRKFDNPSTLAGGGLRAPVNYGRLRSLRTLRSSRHARSVPAADGSTANPA